MQNDLIDMGLNFWPSEGEPGTDCQLNQLCCYSLGKIERGTVVGEDLPIESMHAARPFIMCNFKFNLEVRVYCGRGFVLYLFRDSTTKLLSTAGGRTGLPYFRTIY